MTDADRTPPTIPTAWSDRDLLAVIYERVNRLAMTPGALFMIPTNRRPFPGVSMSSGILYCQGGGQIQVDATAQSGGIRIRLRLDNAWLHEVFVPYDAPTDGAL